MIAVEYRMTRNETATASTVAMKTLGMLVEVGVVDEDLFTCF